MVFINTRLKVDELSNYTINEIETNIFKVKQNIELDELQDKINLCKNLIDIIIISVVSSKPKTNQI